MRPPGNDKWSIKTFVSDVPYLTLAAAIKPIDKDTLMSCTKRFSKFTINRTT